MKGAELGASVGAVVLRATQDGVEKTTQFLGTAFAFSSKHRLFLTATHILPGELRPSHRLVIAVRSEDGKTRYLNVEGTEFLNGQPDVSFLRVSESAVPLSPLCPVKVGVWTRVRSHGVPETLVRPQSEGGFSIGGRGLAGSIQRWIPAGSELFAQGPAWELSFAVPSGASGSPVYAYTEVESDARDLIGVAIWNAAAASLSWSLDSELVEGQWKEFKSKRVVEYGTAADLLACRDQGIELAEGQSLDEISYREVYSRIQ